MEILAFAIWVLIALWCYKIAKKNGRNKVLAVIWGLLFGLIAVAIYAIAGKTSEREDADFERRLGVREAKYGPGRIADKK